MDSYGRIHFPIAKNKNARKKRTEKIILNLHPKSVLDIGGNEYKKFCKKMNIKYTCIDLEEPQKTGEGGYYKDMLVYDGRNLPFNHNNFDLVIINFVFHHASNNALFLLKQIKNITKKYILIGEDLSELNYDIKWHNRNHKHQPGGLFRSDEEWKILFKLYNLKLLKQYIIHRTDDIDNNHIYRSMYLLKKI